MAAHGGLLTREDLAAYEVRVSPPLRGSYRGLELALAPGATGGITALETLNILEQFPPASVGWQTTGGLHARARAVRRAFADRFAAPGARRGVEAPWDRLAAKDYARAVAAALRRPASREAGERGAASARNDTRSADRKSTRLNSSHSHN